MAQQEFKPETLSAVPTGEPSTIKDQFKEGGPAQAPQQPTMEQIMEFRKKEQERMESELPYMRIKEEYNRLEMALYEQGVMLGAIPIKNEEGKVVVPGLLGINLYMQQQESVQAFASYRNNLREQAERMQKEQEEAGKQQANEIAD